MQLYQNAIQFSFEFQATILDMNHEPSHFHGYLSRNSALFSFEIQNLKHSPGFGGGGVAQRRWGNFEILQ